MPHQSQITKMHRQNGQKGTMMYQCIFCKRKFSSSQAIAGHTKVHFKDGWVKGTPQGKVLVPFSDDQQQQGSTAESSIPEKQVFSAESSNTDTENAHRLPKGDALNFGSPATQLSSPASSSRQPRVPRHHLRFRDLKILARLRPRLTGEEQELMSRILDSAMEQANQSSKKSTGVEVITIEDSDDESKNM